MRPAGFARLVLLAAALPVASLATSCGGGGTKTVALDDWVDDLCDIAADFSKASDKAGAAFDDADVTDTKEAKEAFAQTLKEQEKAQKDFRSDFDKIGQPDIEDGDKVIDAFKDQFEANTDLTDDIGKAVADIDDDEDFLEAFFGLVDKFETPDFREKLDDLARDSDDVQDLIDAIDDDQDCSDTIFQDSGGSGAEASATPANSNSGTPTSSSADAPKTQNEKWVAGVCSAFDDWVNNIEAANNKFQGELNKTPEDGPAVKKLLVTYMKAAQAETEDLQSRVSKLKAPDVKDGQQIQQVFVDTTDDLVSAFDDLVSQANRIDTSTVTRALADVTALGDSVDDAFSEASSGFDQLDQLDGGELEDLFDTRPECAGL
ncbi:MAG: hypothetical protein AB7J35_05500 [Dehalococcoidia bacterium]